MFYYVYEDSANVEVKKDILGFLISCQLTWGVVFDKCAVLKTYFKMKLLLSYPAKVDITNDFHIGLRASVKYIAVTSYGENYS